MTEEESLFQADLSEFLTWQIYSFHLIVLFMADLFVSRDSEYIKKEREKARRLRKTRWWREKIQQRLCYHCGKTFSPKALTMDHLVPLARGGKTGKNNVVASCKKCNSAKSFKTLVELKLKKS